MCEREREREREREMKAPYPVYFNYHWNHVRHCQNYEFLKSRSQWKPRTAETCSSHAKMPSWITWLALSMIPLCLTYCVADMAHKWPIGYGVGLRIKRSSIQIRPWPLRWVLGHGSLLPLSQGEAFTLASISYLAILVIYILAKKKKKFLTILLFLWFV